MPWVNCTNFCAIFSLFLCVCARACACACARARAYARARARACACACACAINKLHNLLCNLFLVIQKEM